MPKLLLMRFLNGVLLEKQSFYGYEGLKPPGRYVKLTVKRLGAWYRFKYIRPDL